MKRALLKNKNFSLLLAGNAVSLLGSNMQQFALSLYVLALTGSATIFSTMLAISILPRIILTPFAGVFGDWFDRKKSIVTMDTINGLLIGAYAILFFLKGGISIFGIYLLVVLLEITEIFFGSAMAAVTPSIVKKEELFDANSLKSVVSNVCSMIAPLIAAVLYGVIGMQGMLVMNSVSFLLSAFSETFIEVPSLHKKPEKINMKNFIQDFKEGLGILKEIRILKNIIGLGMILNFSLGAVFNVALVFVLKETLSASDMEIGIFSSLLSLSMVLTPLLLAGFAKSVNLGKLLIYSFIAVSLVICTMGGTLMGGLFTRNMIFVLLIALSFVIGIFVSMANISLGTMFDSIVPKSAMGRVGSVMSLLMTIIQPIGQVLMGVGMDFMKPQYPMILAGVIMGLGVIYYRKPFLAKEDVTAAA
jgi:MFS family permease